MAFFSGKTTFRGLQKVYVYSENAIGCRSERFTPFDSPMRRDMAKRLLVFGYIKKKRN